MDSTENDVTARGPEKLKVTILIEPVEEDSTFERTSFVGEGLFDGEVSTIVEPDPILAYPWHRFLGPRRYDLALKLTDMETYTVRVGQAINANGEDL